MPSPPALFRVSPFFPRVHRLSCLFPFPSSDGLYGHETRLGKRHVSELGNENVADATRFRRFTPMYILLLLTMYPHREQITLAGREDDRDLPASNNISRVCFMGYRLGTKNQELPFDETKIYTRNIIARNRFIYNFIIYKLYIYFLKRIEHVFD